MIYLRVPPTLISQQDDPLEFNLIFKNKNDGKKFLACAKGDILSEDRLKDIVERDDKGQLLVLRMADLESFISTFGNEEKLKEENEEQLRLQKLFEDRKSLLAMYQANEPYNFLKSVREIEALPDFKTMVESVKIEVEAMSLKHSKEFSNLIQYVSFSLSRLSELSAAVAFIFFLCKRINISADQDILEIMCAYAFRELGYGYLHPGSKRNEDPDFQKYPMFTQHLLSLGKISITKNVSRYILEHREKHDSTGFPRGKGEDQTAFNSYIVGGVHELFRVYMMELKGKSFSKALSVSSKKQGIHPELTSVFYSLLPKKS
ncbi:MAG: hypothetical protein CME64_17305 [Halobacteriovoraceae bacterium]|nr:hypothetical protein [Halobacteriovoraceae bacterium]|tara:strand:+ start:288072 stop:289025 length:954 start_codon:yes stop_codon:yes gene_type:complete